MMESLGEFWWDFCNQIVPNAHVQSALWSQFQHQVLLRMQGWTAVPIVGDGIPIRNPPTSTDAHCGNKDPIFWLRKRLPILRISEVCLCGIWTTCPHPALLLCQTMSLLTFEFVQQGSHPHILQARWFANNWGKFPRISSELKSTNNEWVECKGSHSNLYQYHANFCDAAKYPNQTLKYWFLEWSEFWIWVNIFSQIAEKYVSISTLAQTSSSFETLKKSAIVGSSTKRLRDPDIPYKNHASLYIVNHESVAKPPSDLK